MYIVEIEANLADSVGKAKKAKSSCSKKSSNYHTFVFSTANLDMTHTCFVF